MVRLNCLTHLFGKSSGAVPVKLNIFFIRTDFFETLHAHAGYFGYPRWLDLCLGWAGPVRLCLEWMHQGPGAVCAGFVFSTERVRTCAKLRNFNSSTDEWWCLIRNLRQEILGSYFCSAAAHPNNNYKHPQKAGFHRFVCHSLFCQNQSISLYFASSSELCALVRPPHRIVLHEQIHTDLDLFWTPLNLQRIAHPLPRSLFTITSSLRDVCLKFFSGSDKRAIRFFTLTLSCISYGRRYSVRHSSPLRDDLGHMCRLDLFPLSSHFPAFGTAAADP